MKILQPTISIPAWQIDRACILHRACVRIAQAVEAGELISDVVHRVAGRIRGRRYHSQPDRRLDLSDVTLKRHYLKWQRLGKSADAFKLNYKPRRSRIPALVLVRFVEFCASKRIATIKDAWRQFQSRPGVGRCNITAQKISLAQVYYFFPAQAFYQIQAHLKNIETEQTTIAALRLNAIAKIRERIPDRVKKPNPQPEYQI